MADNNLQTDRPILTTEQVSIRRSPKYLTFLIAGAVIGIIVALLIGLGIPEDQRTARPIITYLVAYIGAAGAAVGITSALILDRIFAARAKRADATKLVE